MKNTIKEILNKPNDDILAALAIFPLVIGTIGYLMAGDGITDSLYESFALYFTNPVSDAYNIFIEIARWTAPLALITTVVSVIEEIMYDGGNGIRWRLFRLLGGKERSIAIYTDRDVEIVFEDGIWDAYPKDKFLEYFNNHIILFKDDIKSLEFYEKNSKSLKGKKVYIGLNEIEYGLVKKLDGIALFDINRSIARVLWKEIKLWERKEKALKIVVYGNSPLSRQIIATGLQLNLFSKDQRIEYHMVTDSDSFKERHSDIDLMNNDCILFHKTGTNEAKLCIKWADIVIIADDIDVECFQNILISASGKIYYYSPQEGDKGDVVNYGNVTPFGRNNVIFTDDNIRRGRLILKAKEINASYEEKKTKSSDAKEKPDADLLWNKLNGFLQESNISAADYSEVIKELAGKLEDVDVAISSLAELEHIRWCRFHYLNYWKHSDIRDNDKRLHPSLKPFGELSTEEKQKDIDAVKEALKEG